MDNSSIQVTINVEYANLMRSLSDYDLKMMKKSEKNKAFRHGAKILVKAAKREAPKSKKNVFGTSHNHHTKNKGAHTVVRMHKPGELRRSIGITPRKSKYGGLYVGPRWGAGRANDGFYGVFVERGTERINANPFMERAYNKTNKRVRRRIVQYFEMNFEKYKRKNGH